MRQIVGQQASVRQTSLNNAAMVRFFEEEATIDGPRYRQLVESLANRFDEFFESRGLPIRMSIEKILRDIDYGEYGDGGKSETLAEFSKGDQRGVLHDNQLETNLDVIDHLLTEPHIPGVIIGPPQVGKTGTAFGLHFMGPIFFLLSGGATKYYPIHLIPGRIANENQTKQEFKKFRDLYGDLQFILVETGKKITLNEYSIGFSLNTYRQKVLRNLHADKNGKVRETVGISFNDPNSRIQRRGVPNIKEVKHFCELAKAKDFTPLFIIDEIHHGIGNEGVLSRMLELLNNKIVSPNDKTIFIGFSATPYELHALSKVHQFYHHLTSGSATYTGFNMTDGKAIDATADVKPPTYYGFSQFEEIADIPFSFVSRNRFYSPVAYTAWTKKRGNEEWRRVGHKEYQARTLKAMRAVIHRLLLGESDGTFPEGRGMCLRFPKRNDTLDEFRNRLGLDSAIKIVRYTGESGKRNIQDAIEDDAPEGPYLLLVTGAARMADSFPSDCSYFFEFADNISTVSALMQGLLGRACGWNKTTMVVMADKNAATVDDFVRTMGKFTKQPSRYALPEWPRKSGRPLSNIRIPLDLELCTTRELRYLRGVFIERLDTERIFCSLKPTLKIPDIQDVIKENVFRALEALHRPLGYLPFHLLRFGERTDEGHYYDPTGTVGLRSSKPDGGVLGYSASLRSDRLLVKGSNGSMVQAQLHIVGKDGKRAGANQQKFPKVLVLRLNGTTIPLSDGASAIPNEGSFFGHRDSPYPDEDLRARQAEAIEAKNKKRKRA